MTNGTGFLDEIAELISDRRKEMERTRSRLQQLEGEVGALDTSARIYRQTHGVTESIDASDLKGKTQIQALVAIAKAANGPFRANDAKRTMVQAGLISNPKNAASIVYTLIKTYEHLFEKVEPGVYRHRVTHRRELHPADNLRLASA